MSGEVGCLGAQYYILNAKKNPLQKKPLPFYFLIQKSIYTVRIYGATFWGHIDEEKEEIQLN